MVQNIPCNDKARCCNVSLKENIDSSIPTGKLMLTMIGAIAEFERENILDRQREGIAIAKRNGVYKGRKLFKPDEALFAELKAAYQTRQITKKEFAEKLGVTQPTLRKLLSQEQNKIQTDEE